MDVLKADLDALHVDKVKAMDSDKEALLDAYLEGGPPSYVNHFMTPVDSDQEALQGPSTPTRAITHAPAMAPFSSA